MRAPIHLLLGHDFGQPLASRAAGSLTVSDTAGAVTLEAAIEAGTSWGQDFLAAHRAGLIRGLSPGFQVEPDGERIERRGAELLRTITRAAVFEFSAVTRPAYPQAQIEARRWQVEPRPGPLRRLHPLNRWRA